MGMPAGGVYRETKPSASARNATLSEATPVGDANVDQGNAKPPVKSSAVDVMTPMLGLISMVGSVYIGILL